MAFDLVEIARPYLSETLAEAIGADWAAIVPSSVLVTTDEDHHEPAHETIVCQVPNQRGGRRTMRVGVFVDRMTAMAELADRVSTLRASR